MNAKVVSDGSPQGTKVILDGGAEMKGIARVQWSAEPGEVCRLEVETGVAPIEAEGQLVVYGQHPTEGAIQEIKKIVFADGSEWEAQ